MKNNWTDGEFKTALDGVCQEIEMKRIDANQELAVDHRVTLEDLIIFYYFCHVLLIICKVIM
jgi:hypothetical protein